MILKYFFLLLFSILFLIGCSDQKPKKKTRKDNLFYNKAYAFKESKEIDSAFKYYNKAKDAFLQEGDSLGVGKSLLNMAIFATNTGDYFGGLEISIQALSYFDEKSSKQNVYISSNYTNLGLATYHLRDYQSSLKFYESAIEFDTVTLSKLRNLNNKGKVYEELKNYKEAIKIYNQVLKDANEYPLEYARTLANLAFTKWTQDSNYNPVPEFLTALLLRYKEKDEEGLNYSYATLADYYTNNKPDSALKYAVKMYQIAKKINSPYDQLEALNKLVKLSSPKETKLYFKIYERLDDSLQTARARDKKQFALIRYETEKHKADNLVLQKDNTEKKYQLIKQKSLLIGGLTIAFFTIVISIVLYKKRKQRIELVSQNTIRENQLHTSKKVHDRVANKIYSVISEIENRKELDKDNLLDKLDHIYNTSRDISYEITENPQGKKFSQQLFDMFSSYAADTLHLKIAGNEDELWTTVSNHKKGEVFIVLQELMTNMKKHSRATEVNVHFQKKESLIFITYHDNGIGLPKNVIYNNGLRNTETRIKNISGSITFETTGNKGLEILISFPIH